MPSKKNRSRSNTPASSVRQDTPTKFDSSKCDGEAVINVRLKNYDKEEKREIVNLDAAAALEDVHTRFILNLPPKELATSDRIFFQLEQVPILMLFIVAVDVLDFVTIFSYLS